MGPWAPPNIFLHSCISKRARETRNNLIYNLILLQIRHNLTDIKIETTAVNVIKLSSLLLVKRKNRLECLSLPSLDNMGQCFQKF
jgi:hypothetical protein